MIPDWVVFYEGNSTISMQYDNHRHYSENNEGKTGELKKYVYVFDLEFQCCNIWDECVVTTFKITPSNPPPTRKRETDKFVV